MEKYVKRLRTLQVEENQLNEILAAIRSEINKFQVEQMHLRHQSDDYGASTEGSESEPDQDVQEVIADMESVEDVNKKSLRLEVKPCGSEEIEESD